MRARLIIVGFGNIGMAVASTLSAKKRQLKNAGYDISVVAVCEAVGCLVDTKGLDLKVLTGAKPRWSKKLGTLDTIRDTEADIVVELTPGNVQTGEPGLSHIMAAIGSGKHVVTSNKSPLVVDYNGIMDAAKDVGVQVRYEATVGGAIPVLSTIERETKANTVKNIYGILNGTTNFILTKMDEEAVDFASALAEAQELGYAETDPTYDIKGYDSASKVAILLNTVRGQGASIRDMKIEGINRISPDVMELARDYGYAIRLVGDMDAKEVGPRLVPLDHPLNVGGSLNAILIESDLAQDITLIGHGAGPEPTASAIIADIASVMDRMD